MKLKENQVWTTFPGFVYLITNVGRGTVSYREIKSDGAIGWVECTSAAYIHAHFDYRRPATNSELLAYGRALNAETPAQNVNPEECAIDDTPPVPVLATIGHCEACGVDFDPMRANRDLALCLTCQKSDGRPAITKLDWIRNLPEVGTAVRLYVEREAALVTARNEALAKVQRLDQELADLRKLAIREIRTLWPGNEIEEAKARANV